MDARHRNFLLSLGAHVTPHSGRTLFEHLKGVHDLLLDWDNPQDVRLAGLYHSIYGTEYFKHRSLDDRKKLQWMIGENAEHLVHLFSTAKRPLFENVEDEKTRKKLLEIEAANLIEQGGSPKTLRRLARSGVSNGAKAAISWHGQV